ncbi:hypothetical protein ACN28G_05945 [Micromonospora sp. WMMA1923]|uniref:preATP grasp domain-containing protein n=1 Tax=Micromonospora sp. WMMA1923 TaxID=3404125 RepID=UPI003B936E19
MSRYLHALKLALTGDGRTPLVFLCNFEVEEQWAAHHVGLPALTGRAPAPVVTRMDELGVLLAGPADTVLLHRPMDPEYRAYLEETGFELPTVRTPAQVAADRSTTGALLDSPADLRHLARLGQDGARLLPMGVSVAEQKLAEVAGLPLAVGDAAVFEAVNSKIYSRRIAAELGLRPVPGTCVESVGELAGALSAYRGDLPTDGGTGGALVVKDAYGVSGKGLVVLDSAAKADRLLTMVTRRARRTGDDRLAVVVERWLPRAADLNYQLTIGRTGGVSLDFVKRAHTRGGVHQGHTFPADLGPAHLAEVEQAAQAVGRRLFADGFTGVAGVDAIIDTDGVLYPVLEINARLNMSTYQGGVAERYATAGQVVLARHYPLRLAAPLPFAAVRAALGPLLGPAPAAATGPDAATAPGGAAAPGGATAASAPGGATASGGADVPSGRVVVTCFATVNAEADHVRPPFDGRLHLMLFAADAPRLADLDAAVTAALAPLNHQENR